MERERFRHLVQRLTDEGETVRKEAVLALLREDEAIVGKLIDEFYAGVNTLTGIALLEIIGQIGGYEAVGLMHEIMADSGTKPEWQEIALRWLKHDGLI